LTIGQCMRLAPSSITFQGATGRPAVHSPRGSADPRTLAAGGAVDKLIPALKPVQCTPAVSSAGKALGRKQNDISSKRLASLSVTLRPARASIRPTLFRGSSLTDFYAAVKWRSSLAQGNQPIAFRDLDPVLRVAGQRAWSQPQGMGFLTAARARGAQSRRESTRLAKGMVRRNALKQKITKPHWSNVLETSGQQSSNIAWPGATASQYR